MRENKLTAQLQILKILSRHGIRVDRRSTSIPDAQCAWRSSKKKLAFHAVVEIAAIIGPNNFQTGRLHSAPMLQFSFPNPGPMFELITARILIAGRISRAASDLSFDVMAKNKITSIPIFGRPAWSRVEAGRLTHKHKERAWAERRLTGRITELNQRMWRVMQRLDLETSRCAPVPSRPNSSLVAAHCARAASARAPVLSPPPCRYQAGAVGDHAINP